MTIASFENVKQKLTELSHNPSADNYYNVGLALMRSIEYSLQDENGWLSFTEQQIADEAATCFKEVLALTNQTHGRAAIMLGILLKQQLKYRDAIPFMQIGLQLPSDSHNYAVAVNILAICYLETNQLNQALNILHHALLFHANNVQLQKTYQLLQEKLSTDSSMMKKQLMQAS